MMHAEVSFYSNDYFSYTFIFSKTLPFDRYKIDAETGMLLHSPPDQRWICKSQFFSCSSFSVQVQRHSVCIDIEYKYSLLISLFDLKDTPSAVMSARV